MEQSKARSEYGDKSESEPEESAQSEQPLPELQTPLESQSRKRATVDNLSSRPSNKKARVTNQERSPVDDAIQAKKLGKIIIVILSS